MINQVMSALVLEEGRGMQLEMYLAAAPLPHLLRLLETGRLSIRNRSSIYSILEHSRTFQNSRKGSHECGGLQRRCRLEKGRRIQLDMYIAAAPLPHLLRLLETVRLSIRNISSIYSMIEDSRTFQNSR